MATATYIPIATQTLGSAAASITFSSIPGTYTDLKIILNLNTVSSTTGPIVIQFNGDTATNYSFTVLAGEGTNAVSSSSTSQTYITMQYVGESTTIPTMYDIDVFSYVGSTNKTILTKEAGDLNGSGSVALKVGLWRSTAAITSLTLTKATSGTFGTGTIATLWGI
jgi:hypothetical protein